MMRRSYILGILLLLFGFLMSCGEAQDTGGSEFGNPTRTVRGTVQDEMASLTCPADTVIATDSRAQASSEAVGEDCSVDMALETGRAYVVSFVKNNQFVATLIFNRGVGLATTSVLVLSAGDTPMELGVITINGNSALPETNPFAQNDQDGDGEDDFEDDDDDGDDVDDEDEQDCDLDGYLNDYDEDEDCDEDSEDGLISEVSPFNDEEWVDLDEEIEVRFACEVDGDTVTPETFVVESEDHIVECVFDFESSDNRVLCEHEEDPFLEGAEYTATLNGVTCEDGTPIPETSWTWTTDLEDDEEEDEEED